MSKNNFLKGAAVLGIAGIIVKVIGIFFRIPLTRWIWQVNGRRTSGTGLPM